MNQIGKPPARELLDEFLIGAFNGPPKSEMNYTRYREMADSELDFIVPGNDVLDREANLRALELARECGLRVIPIDMELMQMVHKKSEALDLELLRQAVRDYRPQPAFAGYALADEPHRELFPRLADCVRLLRQMDPDHMALINLYPSYASTEQTGYPDFRSYVRGFIEEVEPALICYDHYTLAEAPLPDRDWFGDLAVVREETLAAKLPFWIFIQSEAIHGNMRIPNRAEIFWQGATALAYGARGLHWFCYWTPATPEALPPVEGKPPLVEEHYNAMLDADGNRTELYHHVRDANRFFKRVGKALLGWQSEAVALYRDGALVQGENPLLKTGGEKINLLLGCFGRGGATKRVLVANASYDEETVFLLRAMDGYELAEVLARHGAEHELDAYAGREGWRLEPGGCLLLEYVQTQP